MYKRQELIGEALGEMDFEELEDVCDVKDLETDPDDYEEDDFEKLRKAIAKELGLKLPAKKEYYIYAFLLDSACCKSCKIAEWICILFFRIYLEDMPCLLYTSRCV